MKGTWDPTIISAKDAVMVRMNAVTAASVLTAALIETGKLEGDVNEHFTTLASAIEEQTLNAGRIQANALEEAGLKPSAVPETVDRAAATVRATFPGSSGGGDAGSVVLKFGKFKGQTIEQAHAEDPKYVEEFLGERTNNEFVKSKVRQFLAG